MLSMPAMVAVSRASSLVVGVGAAAVLLYSVVLSDACCCSQACTLSPGWSLRAAVWLWCEPQKAAHSGVSGGAV